MGPVLCENKPINADSYLETADSSSVAFPSSSDAPVVARPQLRPPFQPFRRISLPTAPSLKHRESVVSVSSFDLLPEDDISPSTGGHGIMRNVNARRSNPKVNQRPDSAEGHRRGNRRKDSIKPLERDEALESKRRKVVREFYETEKAYVDGLELIYSVRAVSPAASICRL